MKKITRFVFIKNGEKEKEISHNNMKYSIQDGGSTLKVFISDVHQKDVTK